MAQLTTSYTRISQTHCGNGGGTDVYIRLYGKYNSQSIANNTTSISLQCRVYFDGNLTTSAVKSKVDGTSKTVASGSKSYSKGEYTLQTVTRTITHKADGTSGSISKSCSWSSYYSSVNGSTSGSFTLPTIPRQASLTSVQDFNDEQNPTIKYTNPAGNSVTSLQVCISFDGSKSDIPYRDVSKTGTSYTFNLTEAERNILRGGTTTGNSRTIRFYIKTVIGGQTYLYYNTKTLTIVNAKPDFSTFTYKDTNATAVGLTGNDQTLIKGVSTLEVSIPSANKMVAKKQATPKNYVIIIGNKNVNIDYSTDDIKLNVGTISSSGTQRLNVNAYDSRNNSATVYKDITVYDYNNPSINASVTRLNNFETTCTLKVSGNFSPLTINGENKNTVKSVQCRYKEKGTSSWTSWQNLTFTITDGQYSCNNLSLSLDNSKAFDIEVQVIDNLSTVSTGGLLSVDVGQSIFSINVNNNELYKNGSDKIDRLLKVDEMFPIGSTYVTSTNNNPSTFLGGEWTLYNKEFKYFTAENNTSIFSINTTNCSALNTVIIRQGHYIFMRVIFTTKVVFNDGGFQIARINFENLGLTMADGGYERYLVAHSDGGNGIFMITISNDGSITSQDVVTKASNGTIPAGQTGRFTYNWQVPYQRLKDEECDRFFWRRTA